MTAAKTTDTRPAASTSNNISVDPLFVDAAAADFSLLAGSPLIDAGTAATEFETDLFGNWRLQGPAVDIGSFEMQPPVGTALFLW